MFKNIIFDFDGTLVDITDITLNSFRAALVETKTEYDESKLNTDLFTMSLDEIFMTLKISGDTKQLIKYFVPIYIQSVEQASIYPGIKEMLHSLKKNDIKLFIATNNFRLVIDKVLKILDIDIFDDIRTQDHDGKKMSKNEMVADLIRRYELDPKNTVMVGDGMNDTIAGKNSGIKTVAVEYGFEPDKNALKNTADFYVKTVDELRTILARWSDID